MRRSFLVARRWFGARLEHPDRFTVIPGNHDRYTDDSRVRFESHFATLADGGSGYPFSKSLPGGITLVCLDVSRPTPVFDSSGRAGPEQIEAAKALIAAREASEFTIVALHYGLLRRGGVPDRSTHGLRDYTALLEMLDASRASLVIHGHIHRPYSIQRDGYVIHCAGSATDLSHGAGYNIYTIDPASRTFSVERRSWDANQGRYAPAK